MCDGARGASRMTAFWCAVLVMLIVLAPRSPLEAAPIAVRLVEGTAHGLLLVRSVSGDIVGHGDFLQAAHRDRVESRLVLRFQDGSRHDETMAFSQQRVFTPHGPTWRGEEAERGEKDATPSRAHDGSSR
jgi:hypothetical protein